MTVAEMQTLVNYRRRESTESFISNDEILAYLQEGNRQVNAHYEYEWNKVSTTIVYTEGFKTYAISAVAPDMNEPINLFHTNNQYFTQVSPEDFDRLSDYSTDIYAIDGNNILIKTSFGTNGFTMNYYSYYTAKTSGSSRIENLSTSSDEPLISENHQDILVDFASARCYQKEGMYDDYKIAYQDFLIKLRKLQTSKPSRKKHQSKTWRSPRRVPGSGVADKTDPLNQLL